MQHLGSLRVSFWWLTFFFRRNFLVSSYVKCFWIIFWTLWVIYYTNSGLGYVPLKNVDFVISQLSWLNSNWKLSLFSGEQQLKSQFSPFSHGWTAWNLHHMCIVLDQPEIWAELMHRILGSPFLGHFFLRFLFYFLVTTVSLNYVLYFFKQIELYEVLFCL